MPPAYSLLARANIVCSLSFAVLRRSRYAGIYPDNLGNSERVVELELRAGKWQAHLSPKAKFIQAYGRANRHPRFSYACFLWCDEGSSKMIWVYGGLYQPGMCVDDGTECHEEVRW